MMSFKNLILVNLVSNSVKMVSFPNVLTVSNICISVYDNRSGDIIILCISVYDNRSGDIHTLYIGT